MTDDPFLQLVCDALGLMNPAFADPRSPAAVAREFYHQFRKLWDRGIPVGMGLGHLVVRDGPLGLDVVRIDEGGRADETLASVGFTRARHDYLFRLCSPDAPNREPASLPVRPVVVRFGPHPDLAAVPDVPAGVAVTIIAFDTKAWTASVG